MPGSIYVADPIKTEKDAIVKLSSLIFKARKRGAFFFLDRESEFMSMPGTIYVALDPSPKCVSKFPTFSLSSPFKNISIAKIQTSS